MDEHVLPPVPVEVHRPGVALVAGCAPPCAPSPAATPYRHTPVAFSFQAGYKWSEPGLGKGGKMRETSRSAYLRVGGSLALVVVAGAALAVLLAPTDLNAAAFGVRVFGGDVCIEKCNERHQVEVFECHIVTIEVPGTLGNRSISQPTGERDPVTAACLTRADANLSACRERCESRTTQLTGIGGTSRSSSTVQRSR